MNPQTRKLLIQRLIPPIGVIGPDFERFGGLVLDHVLSTPLEHSGLNALGFPVSRVLDSSSADGSVVAEYSAEDDYFTRSMPKAERDLAHFIPSPERKASSPLGRAGGSSPDRRGVLQGSAGEARDERAVATHLGRRAHRRNACRQDHVQRRGG